MSYNTLNSTLRPNQLKDKLLINLKQDKISENLNHYNSTLANLHSTKFNNTINDNTVVNNQIPFNIKISSEKNDFQNFSDKNGHKKIL